jgi:hypothetical protein
MWCDAALRAVADLLADLHAFFMYVLAAVHNIESAHLICTCDLYIQSAFSVIGRIYIYCTSNLHSNAPDCLLHTQSAHRKRKCNRLLSKRET